MSDQITGPRQRLGFFHGMLLTAQDLAAEQEHRLGKDRLHARTLHSPGVVPHVDGGLRVQPHARHKMTVEVSTGHAIDGRGRGIHLGEWSLVNVDDVEGLERPATVFVAVAWREREAEMREYPEEPDYRGYARVEEAPSVFVTKEEPNGIDAVEIARILIAADTTELKTAADPERPLSGEIDHRFVARAGVTGAFLPPLFRRHLGELLGRRRKELARMQYQAGFAPAALPLQTVGTLELSNAAGILSATNLVEVLSVWVSVELDFIEYLSSGQVGSIVPEPLGAYRGQMEALRTELGGGRFGPETRRAVEGTLRETNDLLARSYVVEERVIEDVLPVRGPKITWEELFTWGNTMADWFFVNGSNWKQVDRLAPRDEKSVKNHDLKVANEKSATGALRTYRYPNGEEHEDRGLYQVEGTLSWRIGGLEPGADLLLVRRIDYKRGAHFVTVHVDGAEVGQWRVEGEPEGKHYWRNAWFVVPSEFVKGTSVRLSMRLVDAERDVSTFQMWFYQRERT